MFEKFKNHLNTEIGFGIKWVHIHTFIATIIAVLALIFFVIIPVYFTYHLLHGDYFRHKYKAPLQVPKHHQIIRTKPKSTPLGSFLVNLNYLYHVQNQDGLGACQAFAVYSYQIPYLFNKHYHRSWATTTHPWRMSARMAYDYVTHGFDDGSYFPDVVNVAQKVGVPFSWYFPYGRPTHGLPAFADDSQIPQDVYQSAIKYNIATNYAFTNIGPGMAGIDNLKALMTKYQGTANINIPVFPEFDNASITAGKIGNPTSNESSRGGHAVTFIGFNDKLRIQNKDKTWTTGAFIGINQWDKNWGGTINLQTNNGHNGGYFALPYSFVAKYGWNGAVLSVSNWSVPVAPQSHKNLRNFKNPNPAPIPTPPTSTANGNPTGATGNWYVKNVYTNDLGRNNFDLAQAMDQFGTQYGIAPLGLAAISFSECNLNTGGGNYNVAANPNDDCSRYGAGQDVSFGATQEIPSTAGQFGVGDGSFSGGNINYVHWWENHPKWSEKLAAQVLGYYHSITGLNFTPLAVAWNCGPGWSTYQLENPYTISYQCGLNHDHFLQWWYDVQRFAVPNDPFSKVFNVKLWNAYTNRHHLNSIPYKDKKGKLGYSAQLWEGSDTVAGPAISHEQFYGPNRHQKYGFVTMRFSHLRLYWWPHHPWIKWQQVRSIT